MAYQQFACPDCGSTKLAERIDKKLQALKNSLVDLVEEVNSELYMDEKVEEELDR